MAEHLDPGAAPGTADQPSPGRRRSRNPLRSMIQHLTVESPSGTSDGSGSRRSSLIRRLSGQKSRSPSAHSDAASSSRPNSRPASSQGVNRDPALCDSCARLAAEMEETLDEVDATFARPADGGAAGDFATQEHFVARLRFLEENRWAATCPLCKLFWDLHVPSKEPGDYHLVALSTRDTSYFIDSAKMHSQDHPAKGRAKGLSPAFFSVISKAKAGGRDPEVDPEWFREAGMLLRTRPEMLVDAARGRTGPEGRLAVSTPGASPLPSPTLCLPDDASWTQRGVWGRDIDKVADLNIVREWLHFCDNHHQGRCSRRPVRAEMAGFRLIDCAQSPPRVVERSLRDDYVALSYVWGDANVEDGSWPQVVRDAAAVVTQLGFRYLWVDRYCTDDSRPDHKLAHVQRMDEIYEGAAFTIIAAAGENAMHGLPGVGVTSRPAQPKYKFTTSNITLVSSLQDPRLLIERSTWFTRGWTYQEGLLSRRRLVFTEQQMYWECEGMACPEAIDLPFEFYHDAEERRLCDFVRPGLFNGVSYMDGSWEQWKKLPQKLGEASTLSIFREVDQHITKYTSRNLSRDEDSLDASLGIWRELESTLGRGKLSDLVGIPMWAPLAAQPAEDKEGPVLPRTRHLFALSTCFWHHKVGTQARRRNHLPSWSWAGWSGPVELFSSITIAADAESRTKGRKILNHHYVTATQLTRNEQSSVQWTYSPEMAVLAPDGTMVYDFGDKLVSAGPPRFRPGKYALHVQDPLVLDRVKAKTHSDGWLFSGLSVDVRMSRGSGTETACLGGEEAIGSIKEYITKHGKGEQMSVLWFVEEALVMLLVVEKTSKGTWERVGRMRMAFKEDAKDVVRACGRLEELVGRLPLRRLGENIVIE
ncbi:hypothetical protein CCMA1212_006951 [Trichoderma ghanense]|uniref:Heterokaryon incompatibility domain-containing protein n=1 Tax=Trichoderma ghanense TaxID=65468 RepID=A0ABY2H0Y3_9HYPO